MCFGCIVSRDSPADIMEKVAQDLLELLPKDPPMKLRLFLNGTLIGWFSSASSSISNAYVTAEKGFLGLLQKYRGIDPESTVPHASLEELHGDLTISSCRGRLLQVVGILPKYNYDVSQSMLSFEQSGAVIYISEAQKRYWQVHESQELFEKSIGGDGVYREAFVIRESLIRSVGTVDIVAIKSNTSERTQYYVTNQAKKDEAASNIMKSTSRLIMFFSLSESPIPGNDDRHQMTANGGVFNTSLPVIAVAHGAAYGKEHDDSMVVEQDYLAQQSSVRYRKMELDSDQINPQQPKIPAGSLLGKRRKTNHIEVP
jgi:hypothetical protein